MKCFICSIVAFLLLGLSNERSIDDETMSQIQLSNMDYNLAESVLKTAGNVRDDLREIFEKAREALSELKQRRNEDGLNDSNDDSHEGSGGHGYPEEDSSNNEYYTDVPEKPKPWEEATQGSGSGNGSGSGEGSVSDHNEGSGGGPNRGERGL